MIKTVAVEIWSINRVSFLMKHTVYHKNVSLYFFKIISITYKMELLWHDINAKGIRKKHAKNQRDISINEWAVSRLVNLQKKETFCSGTRQYRNAITPAVRAMRICVQDGGWGDVSLWIMDIQRVKNNPDYCCLFQSDTRCCYLVWLWCSHVLVFLV